MNIFCEPRPVLGIVSFEHCCVEDTGTLTMIIICGDMSMLRRIESVSESESESESE